jgi:hypothetical protein
MPGPLPAGAVCPPGGPHECVRGAMRMTCGKPGVTLCVLVALACGLLRQAAGQEAANMNLPDGARSTQATA